MPTDGEGQKWSCEACIRGHRAARCLHFDRWMVRVKNPGRPLRECPHVSGPCPCVGEKVMMVKIPRSPEGKECRCRRMTREELGHEATQLDQHPQRQKRRSGPSPITPYPSAQPAQSLPTSADAQYLAFPEQLTNVDMSAWTSRRASTRELRAESSLSVPMQHAMQTQQQPIDLSSMSSTPPAGASQSYYQKHSNLLTRAQSPAIVQGRGSPQPYIAANNVFFNPVPQNGSQSESPATVKGRGSPQPYISPSNVSFNPGYHSLQQNGTQSQSPTTVQGEGSTQHFGPASNVSSSPDGHSAQQNGTHFQPYMPIYTHHKTVLPDQNGHSSVATLTPSPDLLVQLGMDLSSYAPEFIYPPSQNNYPLHTSTAVPGMNDATRMDIENCSCGPNCNCLYCTSHPHNPANSELVQDLTEILASDNSWNYAPNPNPSQPQSETGDALTNGSRMESAMDLIDVDPFDSSPLGNVMIPGQMFDQGGSVNDSDQSNEFATPQMVNSNYVTVEYPLKGKCTNGTGTCLCRNKCACSGCRTHRGHVETPDLSELPML